jgi:hypothetical protein
MRKQIWASFKETESRGNTFYTTTNTTGRAKMQYQNFLQCCSEKHPTNSAVCPSKQPWSEERPLDFPMSLLSQAERAMKSSTLQKKVKHRNWQKHVKKTWSRRPILYCKRAHVQMGKNRDTLSNRSIDESGSRNYSAKIAIGQHHVRGLFGNLKH